METTGVRPHVLRSPGRSLGAVTLAFAAVALVTGCASPGGGSAGSDDPAIASEADYVGTWGTDDPQQPHLVIADDGTVSGSDGCNSLSGAWEFDPDDGTIEFDQMASTMMACDGVDQSLALLDWASVDGDTLTVYGDDDAEITTLPRTE